MDVVTQPPTLPQSTAECHVLIGALVRDIAQYRQRIDWLTRRLFGAKSEKMDPLTPDLFAQESPAQEEKIPEPPVKMTPARRGGHGRQVLPADLPRERRVHDLPEEQKICPECGQMRERIGEETSEQLDYIPASLHVIEHVRPKYACKRCQGSVAQGEKPPQAIEKGLPGPGLLAHVITSKYCDHLPLNRQENILARHGVELSRSTLCDWMMHSAELLEPLVRSMQKQVLLGSLIHTDDTGIAVQAKTKTHRAHLWVYLGDGDHPYSVYDFTWTRGREGPEAFLKDYEGYLQADAFSGYDRLYGEGKIVEVGCWAHARRYFFEAKGTDPVAAHDAMARIGALYKIEAQARDLGPARRRDMRREHSAPLLEAFGRWMEENRQRVLPRSPIAQAITYAQNHWGALCRFAGDGNLAIDNNAAERALRPICVGRNNWLFAGSERGGHAAAILYSLIASAKRHGLDPFAYLRDVLEILPSLCHKRITELFPDKWKALQEADADPIEA